MALHKSRCFSSVTSSLSTCTDRKHQVCMSTTFTRSNYSGLNIISMGVIKVIMNL